MAALQDAMVIIAGKMPGAIGQDQRLKQLALFTKTMSDIGKIDWHAGALQHILNLSPPNLLPEFGFKPAFISGLFFLLLPSWLLPVQPNVSAMTLPSACKRRSVHERHEKHEPGKEMPGRIASPAGELTISMPAVNLLGVFRTFGGPTAFPGSTEALTCTK
jgi:hypothetical protein